MKIPVGGPSTNKSHLELEFSVLQGPSRTSLAWRHPCKRSRFLSEQGFFDFMQDCASINIDNDIIAVIFVLFHRLLSKFTQLATSGVTWPHPPNFHKGSVWAENPQKVGGGLLLSEKMKYRCVYFVVYYASKIIPTLPVAWWRDCKTLRWWLKGH